MTRSRSPHPAGLPVRAHEYNVHRRRREIPVHGPTLRNIPDLFSLFTIGPAEDPHGASDRADQPEDGLEKSRLARAVRPDDSHEHPLRDGQIDVPQNRLVAVGDRQILDLHSGSGRGGGVRRWWSWGGWGVGW